MEPRTAYWKALEGADRPAALRVVEELYDDGVTDRTIAEDLICPTQKRVGELWQAGTWSYHREHSVTSINEAAVRWLAAQADPPPTDAPVQLVACLEAEEHTLAALIVAGALVSAGRPVHHLAGSTSGEDLVACVGRIQPRAVLLSASLTSSLAPHRPVLEALRCLGVPVLVGGSAWAGNHRRAEQLGATAYAGSIDEAMTLLDILPATLPIAEPRPPSSAEVAAEKLLAQRLVIAAQVASELLTRLVGAADRLPSWWPDLDNQLHHVVGCLAAAMMTGDVTIMEDERDWLTALLASRRDAPPAVPLVWELLGGSLVDEHLLARQYLDAAPAAPAPEA